MTQKEITEFREQYNSIVYKYSQIRDNEEKLKSLHAWDKNGSHDKAIIQKLDERKRLKEELNVMLKGKTYDEWKSFSKHLSKLQTRYNELTKKRDFIFSELNHLTF